MSDRETDSLDLVIVGAGPAGAAAAILASRSGMSVCVIDEQSRFGGQIYRQPPVGFHVDRWLPGKSYAQGKKMILQAENLAGVQRIFSATVWGIFPGVSAGIRHHVLFHAGDRLGRISARHVLIATGCYEMPVPFAGWDLPGVMTAGAIQTLLKSQRVAAGARIVLAGTHPLLLTVADQLVAAGIGVAAVVFQQPVSAALRLVRSIPTVLPVRRQILDSLRTLFTLRRTGVPLLFGHHVFEAMGTGRLKAVRLRDIVTGKSSTIQCDVLGTCYGFLSSSELARQAGAVHLWSEGSGWVIVADELMRTSVRGLSVAGEQIGVAGAEAAVLSGELAALGILADLGRPGSLTAQRQLRQKRRRLTKLHRFARTLASLSAPIDAAFEGLSDPTVLLCRCEDITVGAFKTALSANPEIASANTAKLVTRVGMGICQGRMCESNVRRVVALQRGCSLAEVPGYVVRCPVKPIPMGVLASVPGALDIDPARVGQNVAENATRRTEIGY